MFNWLRNLFIGEKVAVQKNEIIEQKTEVVIPEVKEEVEKIVTDTLDANKNEKVDSQEVKLATSKVKEKIKTKVKNKKK